MRLDQKLWLAVLAFMVTTLVLRWRRTRMQEGFNATKVTKSHLIHNILQPGDIVFMSSRVLPLYKPHSYYTIWASAIQSTPWYHVFLVLRDQKLAHFIMDSYDPQLGRPCRNRNPHLQVGHLDMYVSQRAKYSPLYLVLRRPVPVVFDDHIQGLCNALFPWLPLIGLNMVLPVVEDSSRYLHCNSYVGVLLQNMGLLPRTISHPNRTFIPVRLLDTYLPQAGYRSVGTFDVVHDQ